MNHIKIRETFTRFFEKQGHIIVSSSSLLPEDDPSVLLTTAGMQQFKPYMSGQKDVMTDIHQTTGKPLRSRRLASIQKSFRTTDIDEVGDTTHLTFFEMLGNFSIGDYFKKEAIAYAWKILTEDFHLPKENLWVTVFEGEGKVPKDTEAIKIWEKMGVPASHIFQFGRKDNFWGPTGDNGPCGPCSEIHFDFGKHLSCGKNCGPNCECGRFLEIWNLVFMEFFQDSKGNLTPLSQKNIDTGMGLERIARVLQDGDSIFSTDLFLPLIQKIGHLSLTSYERPETVSSFRIISDHVRGAVFLVADGVVPSNKEEGYILRRVIRRATLHAKKIGLHEGSIEALARTVISEYGSLYPRLQEKSQIVDLLSEEEGRFLHTLQVGMRELQKIIGKRKLTAEDVFGLFETYGLPYDMTFELVQDQDLQKNRDTIKAELDSLYQKHQEKSRQSGKMFKSDEIAPAHSAAHLLNQALREVLGSDIHQRGQKIGVGEFRHDFNFPRKLTREELRSVEDLVNEKIKEDLPVQKVVTTFEQAKKERAEALFKEKYKNVDQVTLYTIGSFSKELCGGPHVTSTKEIGHFTLKKEESVSAGVRRIYGKVQSR
ncbi:MAG TPA: alanine--tRNA ligase [Patescibacteria group bacterium]|nr:alanine--tRNA ligase [Patescibacteria group bacterium]